MINTEGLLWVLLYVIPFAYFAVCINYMVLFFTDSPRARKLAHPMLVAAVALNGLYLAAFTVYFEHIPLVSVHQVFGAVGFAGVSELFNGSFSNWNSETFHPNAGLGIRIMLNEANRMNFRIDYAWGDEDEEGLYVGVGEIF